jgi:hypothetical protein
MKKTNLQALLVYLGSALHFFGDWWKHETRVGSSPVSPLQQKLEYRPDTENIEHGVTEALHTK